MTCFSYKYEYVIYTTRYVYLVNYFWVLFLLFSAGVFLSSRVTGACPVTTDLSMRVHVTTTTAVVRGACDLSASK